MNASLRIVGFVAALGAVLGVAWVAGRAIGPDTGPMPEHGDHRGDGAADDFRLTLEQTAFGPGTHELAFRVERDGAAVTDYEVAHEKELHLIVVRTDMSGFQHLHPTLDGDTWRTDVAWQPGEWKVYADFTPVGAEAQVLTEDLTVSGQGTSGNRHDTVRTVHVDGYDLTLRGDLQPGATTVLRPDVTRGGQEVTDLEPYLGALGHLVALRHGTLEYLHVHPEGLDFHTSVEKPGTYELFLQFQHRGKVHTAQFTLPAEQQPSQTQTPTGTGHGHGH